MFAHPTLKSYTKNCDAWEYVQMVRQLKSTGHNAFQQGNPEDKECLRNSVTVAFTVAVTMP